MVILTAKPGVTPDQIVKIMPAEIRATLKLYLDGTIRQYHLNQVCGGSAAFLFGRRTYEICALTGQR